ncbi:MAG: tetratricopeptide repeat protein, partial [Thermoguttaceae bacterium]
PGDADACVGRGVAYLRDLAYDNAIADFTEAIRLSPTCTTAYNFRGLASLANACLGKGEYGKAIADFTEAIRLDPKHAAAYHSRGYSYALMGEKAKAEADFAQANRLGYRPGQDPGGGDK